MKRLISILAAACLAVTASAQDLSSAIELTKKGAELTYECLLGTKLVGHSRVTVVDVKVLADSTTEVTTLCMPLNKKMQPSKNAKMVGLGDGMYNLIKFNADGSYVRKYDWTFGALKDMTRSGFMMKMPAKLEVGMELECGEVSYVAALMGGMGRKQSGTLKYSNWKVVAEEEITLPVGIVHCFKLTGNIDGGPWQTMTIHDNQTWWVAPGLGIVKMEVNYYGNKPIVTQLKIANGL